MTAEGDADSTRPTVLRDIIDRSRAEPDHVAAADLDRELTYAELIDHAGRVGAGLAARGVTEGDRVAILVPNSVDFLVAALATLWIGATFVPLAATDPLPRLNSIVEDSAPTLIVSTSRGDSEVPEAIGRAATVALEELLAPTPAPEYSRDAPRVAYMIYTSGTTGKPKGVQIGDTAFHAAVHSTADALGLDHRTRTLCVSPFHFDGSYANLFPTLVSGGTVVMRPRESLLYPRTFYNTIATEQITYSGFTPSYLRLLLASPQLSTLRDSTLTMIALGGEAISVADLRALWSTVPSIRVFNRYGPTETTIAVTNVELTSDMIEGGVVTMGHPHPGVTFTLVSDSGEIVDSPQQVGELYVGGVQLMSGYWSDDTLTASVLREDVVPGQTLYRTGDLVYRMADGDYVYVDRADRVLKRSGVRISLVEVSSTLNQLDHVTAAACLTFDHDGEVGIVAFVTLDTALSALELRRAAHSVLPANMVPDRFEVVDAMPLNRSNALDESGLRERAGLRPFRAS
jgi:D-alanine--poly(phosphoribitol) ligase subunit 1